jgi:ankyrin repeat protein
MAQEMNCFIVQMAWYKTNKSFQGALNIACQKGNVAIIVFLLKNGADINHRNIQELTPLHTAIYQPF